MRRDRLASGAVALALVCGCGGGGGGEDAVRTDAQVVDAWAEAVRTGDIAEASALFALPATIANGAPPVRLTRRGQVEAFNRSLPCGAVVLDSRRANGGYLRVTFRLTPGRACGSGTGDEADVSFKIEDGRIVEWIREAAGPPPGSTDI